MAMNCMKSVRSIVIINESTRLGSCRTFAAGKAKKDSNGAVAEDAKKSSKGAVAEDAKKGSKATAAGDGKKGSKATAAGDGKKGSKGAGAGDASKASTLDMHTKSTTVVGANILKEGEDPKILADSEYPDWLFCLLDKRPTLSELRRKNVESLPYEVLMRFAKLDNRARIKENNGAKAKK